MAPDRRKYADRREALIKAVTKRRKKIKVMAIEYKGNKCQICGYRKYPGALELHHLDRQIKKVIWYWRQRLYKVLGKSETRT